MAHQPSSRENLLNEIRGNATSQEQFDRLKRMVDEHEQESEWLDFKAAGHVGDRKTDAKSDEWLKAEWSKYLSAFANSGGGLVVWGIETKHDPEKRRDLAEKFNHVRQPDQFEGRLDELLNSATYPPVSGVLNLAVKEPGKEYGCVVSYVPNSPYKPHRAEYAGQCYFTRVDDGCGVLAHETLRHCFFPKVSPQLQITLFPTYSVTSEMDETIQDKISGDVTFRVEISNVGNGT